MLVDYNEDHANKIYYLHKDYFKRNINLRQIFILFSLIMNEWMRKTIINLQEASFIKQNYINDDCDTSCFQHVKLSTEKLSVEEKDLLKLLRKQSKSWEMSSIKMLVQKKM